MKSFVQTVAGIAVAALVAILFGARIMLDLIGYTTAPDDFALFQQRLPQVLDWLFSTPWWVPSILMAGLIALAAWLLVSGTKRAVKEEVEDQSGLNREQVEEIVAAAMPRLPEQPPIPDIEGLLKPLRDEIQGVTANMISFNDARVTDLKNQREIINELVERLAGLPEKVAETIKFVEAHIRETTDRFDNVDRGFIAIRKRERLLADAEIIKKQAVELLRLKRGEAISDWTEWQGHRQIWEQGIRAWAELAIPYRDGCEARILQVNASQLRGNWPETIDMFPNEDLMMLFRETEVMFRQFATEMFQVDEAVSMAAFHGPSKKYQRNAFDP